MTAKQLIQASLALFNDNNLELYSTTGLPCLNLLLGELFELNNRLRQASGLERLTEIPQLENDSEQVPYQPQLLYGALPYGLAAKLFLDDRDTGVLSYLQQQYDRAVAEVDRGYVEIQPMGSRWVQ